MDIPWRLVFSVAAILVIALTGAFFLRKEKKAEFWLPLGIAIASLVVSLVASFKAELITFMPRVLADTVWVVHDSSGDKKKLCLVVPLFFSNAGYGEGVVRDVALKITSERGGYVLHFQPTAEIDTVKLMASSFRLTPECVIAAWNSFPLDSKEVVRKPFLFNCVSTSTNRNTFEAGVHRFEVFVLGSNMSEPKALFSWPVEFTEKDLADFERGTSFVRVNHAIESFESAWPVSSRNPIN